MKTVTGRVISSKPISLSKAASTLSSFLSTDNGASPALSAYLRRASASFNDLKQLHKELRSSRPDRKQRHPRSKVFSDLEAAVDKPYRSEASHEISHRIGDSEKKNSSVSESKNGKKPVDGKRNKDGKITMAIDGNGGFEDVIGEDGKRKGGQLKIEVEDKHSRRVEMDVESSDRVKSTVAVENRRKKHKKKSEEEHGKIGGDDENRRKKHKKKSDEEHGKIGGDDERDGGAKQSFSKSRISDNNNGEIEAAGDLVENNVGRGKDRKKHEDKKNMEVQRRRDTGAEETTGKNNDDGKDLVELPIKKKKKKKKREEDAGDLQNNNGGAIEKEGMPVLDSKELKRKEKKKRKNRDLEEGGDDGSEEQQSTKKRKGNL